MCGFCACSFLLRVGRVLAGRQPSQDMQKQEQERCICPYSMATSSNQQTINQKPTRNLTWLNCIHCDLDWWFQFLSATLKKNEKHILHDFIAVYGPQSRQTNSAERWVAKLKNEKHHHDSTAGCKAIQRHQYDNTRTRRPKSKIQTSHHRATTMLPIRPHRCWLKPYS